MEKTTKIIDENILDSPGYLFLNKALIAERIMLAFTVCTVLISILIMFAMTAITIHASSRPRPSSNNNIWSAEMPIDVP